MNHNPWVFTLLATISLALTGIDYSQFQSSRDGVVTPTPQKSGEGRRAVERQRECGYSMVARSPASCLRRDHATRAWWRLCHVAWRYRGRKDEPQQKSITRVLLLVHSVPAADTNCK
ncbi:hypothetical protein CC85DRAFT_169586 [Cutaneotrichosporon oleaginosum]|uniref:Uncharacterized protein n=1 Tax=Cutaneotrichosporon oleaginosum TaxID=879819 RepID=A0A0J0XVB7_9TREE|nr:uncharacterized protein CC85DRAFT_169586 [Cutaneotrichosporon oleaginosum]KLT45010.1 hypothetical protein CC85DRAFT_169586 [Cutaneotrichosporon oleaginosum]TXT09698.1 hypothetical protein COLE_03632 [Cutaneotrichosporon oleaginosum]